MNSKISLSLAKNLRKKKRLFITIKKFTWKKKKEEEVKLNGKYSGTIN